MKEADHWTSLNVETSTISRRGAVSRIYSPWRRRRKVYCIQMLLSSIVRTCGSFPFVFKMLWLAKYKPCPVILSRLLHTE